MGAIKIAEGYTAEEIKIFAQKTRLMHYHVPKCGGVTLVASLRNPKLKFFRAWGPPFGWPQQIDSDAVLARKKAKYLDNVSLDAMQYSSVNHLKETLQDDPSALRHVKFLSGHIPYKVMKNLPFNWLTFTVLRDPISRAMSHHNFFVNRKLISRDTSIDELYTSGYLDANLMTKFFSSEADPSVDRALANLSQIDVVADIKDIGELMSLIVSVLNLPNIVYTNHNTQKIPLKYSLEDITNFERYNALDLELYSQASEIFYDFTNVNKKFKESNEFSFMAPHPIFDGKRNVICTKDQFENYYEIFKSLTISTVN